MRNRDLRNLSRAGNMLLASTVIAVAVIFLVNASQIRAQSRAAETLRFDVASVKPHAPDGEIYLPAFLPGGRFRSSVPLSMVIAAAYGLPFNTNTPVRLSEEVQFTSVKTSKLPSGVPAWALTFENIYDIEATAIIPAELSTPARNNRMRSMLQTLLADRFKLKIHRQTVEMPVYALVVGKGGAKLEKADIEEKDCPDADAHFSDAPWLCCHTLNGDWEIGLHGRAVTMSDLVTFVVTDRPLVDKTGIKGLYRIETTGWLPMDGLVPAPGATSLYGTVMSDLPPIFAVFEKLGLKMERQNGKVEVYIVDHVEKPAEN
jgi:uncharacterized protein (TIGR03435 family)